MFQIKVDPNEICSFTYTFAGGEEFLRKFVKFHLKFI
jgi:hypothetical protein